MQPESSISIPMLFMAVKNNLGKALLTLFLTLVIAALAIMYLPRKYRSEAIIFVRLGRESVSLDPTATTGSTISVLESRDNEVNSIRDMLQSRGLLESVVDRLGAKVVLGEAEIPEQLLEPEIDPQDDFDKSDRQMAIKMLEQKLYINTARKSSVLQVGVAAASPKLAQRILQLYLDSYKAMHADAHQTPKSNQFFAAQTSLLQQQWLDSMAKLQDSKQEAGVVSIEIARENLSKQINETQSQLMDVESQRTASEARLKKLEEMADRNPLDVPRIREDLIETKAGMASLTAEYESVTIQLCSLLEDTTALNHDEVEIRQLEQEVAAAESNHAQYRELYEQTRVEEALRSSKFTNVKIVQEPSFVPKAVSPSKRGIAAAGLVAGTSGAFLVAFLFEFFLKRRDPRSRQASSNPNAVRDHELVQNGNL